ncbi:MAG: translocation/assembly module TamB domain-containing protein [Chitinophagales bacterium]
MKKKLLKIGLVLLSILFFVLTGIVLFLNSPKTQTWLLQKTTQYLSDKLETEVHIDHAYVDIYTQIVLDNVLVEDLEGDTLLFVEALEIEVDKLALFGKKLEVKGITLQNPYFHLFQERTATENNLSQLLAKLSSKEEAANMDETPSEKEGDTAKVDSLSTPAKDFPISISLQDFKLHHPRIHLENHFAGNDTWIELEDAVIEVENLDIQQKMVALKSVLVSEPDVRLCNWESFEEDDEEDDYTTFIPINQSGWTFSTETLQIADGAFSIENDRRNTELLTKLINFDNLGVDDIQIDLSQVVFGWDSLGGIIEHLSAKEKSGFVLSNLAANVTFTPTMLEFDGLCLITPNSYLGDYYAMHYRSLGGFLDYNHHIRMDAHFEKGIVTLEDISYFAKGLSDVKLLYAQRNQPIEISGNLSNKVSRLRAEDLKLRLANTFFAGSFKLSGLPDVASTNIDFKVEQLGTDIMEVRRLLPNLQIPKNFDKLGNWGFSGRFSGFPSDFVADGTLRTNIGKVGLDMKMVTNERIAAYSGDLELIDFQLGNWLGDTKQFGLVSFSSRIEGEGLRLQDLHATIDGDVQQLEFNGYDYRDLSVDGKIDQRLFSGKLRVDDPNLRLDFEGMVDLNSDVPQYNFNANVQRINLHRLNLSKKKNPAIADIVLAGKTHLNLKGNNLDNIEGDATLANFRFQQGKRIFEVEKLKLESKITDLQRTLEVRSDVLDADLVGKFTFEDMVPAFKNYLYHYFPHHFPFPKTTRPQQFAFEATLKKPVSILQTFVPELKEVQEGTIVGSFDSQTKVTFLDVDIPAVTFDGLTFHEFYYHANSKHARQFDFSLGVKDIFNNKKQKTAFPEIKMEGIAFNDSIDFDLKLASDTSANWGAIAGVLSLHTDTLKLGLDKTIGAFNYEKWEGSTGLICFKDKNYFTIEDVLLQNGNQKIGIRSRPSKSYQNYTEVILDSVIVEQFQQIPAIRNQGLKGMVSGQVDIRDVFEEQTIAADLKAAGFEYRGQKLGLVSVGAKKSKLDNSIRIFADVNNNRFKIAADGFVHLPKKEGEREQLDFEIKIKKGDFAFVEAYVGSHVSDTEGKITGLLKLYGDPIKPTIEGEVLVADGKTTVDYLQTSYSFHNQKVSFRDNSIIVSDGSMTDMEDNSAKVDARLSFNDFVNLSIDARIETQGERFLCLNTRYADNEQYYGTAYANGFITFKGPLNQLQMYVNARSEKGTVLHVPINYNTDISNDNFYTFINKEEKTEKGEDDALSFSGMRMVFDFEMTPDAEIQFIFDKQAGDIMRGRGNGDIQMIVNTIGDFGFDMYGKYTIEEGSYLFTLQNLVNKYFKVEKGGTVVFAGDPYKALLDVSAIYSLEATRSDLIEEDEKALLLAAADDREVERELRKRIPVDVYLMLTGSLEVPNVEFDMRLPELGTSAVDNLTANKIKSINRFNIAELNKQIFGLLVLNRFLPSERFEVSGTVIEEGVITTVSEFLSNQLSNYLGEIVSNLIPDSDFNVIWRNYQLEDLSSSSPDLKGDRNEIELTFTKRLFNDKVSINVGGNFDVGNNQVSGNANNVLFAADFVLEYKITSDGKFKVRFFNKTDYDIFNEQYNKTGAAIFWTHEFERFRDFFSSKKKKQQNFPQTLPPEFLPPAELPQDTLPLETILELNE